MKVYRRLECVGKSKSSAKQQQSTAKGDSDWDDSMPSLETKAKLKVTPKPKATQAKSDATPPPELDESGKEGDGHNLAQSRYQELCAHMCRNAYKTKQNKEESECIRESSSSKPILTLQ